MSDSPIKLVSVKCPDCGASLSIEEGRARAFCTYCGAAVIVSNSNERITRTINEAEIKRAEAEKEIRLKKLEQEAEESKEANKSSKRGFYMLFAFALIIWLMILIMWFTR